MYIFQFFGKEIIKQLKKYKTKGKKKKPFLLSKIKQKKKKRKHSFGESCQKDKKVNCFHDTEKVGMGAEH